MIMDRRLLIGAALLALAGCDRGGGEAERQAKQGLPDVNPANITIATPEARAEIRSGGGALAAGLPEGIPPYPGADTSQSVQVTGDMAQGDGRILGFRTADSPAQVIAFYVAAAGRAGFTISQQMDMGGTALLVAQRGQADTINVTATGSPRGTQVQIVVATGQR